MRISKNNLIIVNLVVILLIFLGCLFLINAKKNHVSIKCSNQVEPQECWRNQLDESLESDGLSASFEVLANLYETEKDFVSECHSFTHELGEKTYKMFLKSHKIEMTPKASYCGYGFYHGFMETLLHSGGGMELAQKFCLDIDRQLSFFGDKTALACYHGIGHGAVDGGDPRAFGSPQKLIDPGLSICASVSSEDRQIHQCGTGVFNALALALNANSFGLNSSENPYKICSVQSDLFKKSCYEQMNTRVAQLSNGDFASAVKFLYGIKNQDDSIVAMEQLAPSLITKKIGKNSDYKSEVAVCRSLPNYLDLACINGLVGGILEFGKPDYEYIEATSFCESLGDNQAEKNSCFRRLTSSLPVLYSKEKTAEICDKIAIDYRKGCLNQ